MLTGRRGWEIRDIIDIMADNILERKKDTFRPEEIILVNRKFEKNGNRRGICRSETGKFWPCVLRLDGAIEVIMWIHSLSATHVHQRMLDYENVEVLTYDIFGRRNGADAMKNRTKPLNWEDCVMEETKEKVK